MPRKTIMTNIAYDTERHSYYVTLYSGQSKAEKSAVPYAAIPLWSRRSKPWRISRLGNVWRKEKSPRI